MNEQMKEQCELIAMHYGEHSQLGIMIEEAAELIQAISKMQRRKMKGYGIAYCRLHYIEELAVVSIMAEQLITLLNAADYESFKELVEYELDKQMDRMKDEEEAEHIQRMIRED